MLSLTKPVTREREREIHTDSIYYQYSWAIGLAWLSSNLELKMTLYTGWGTALDAGFLHLETGPNCWTIEDHTTSTQLIERLISEIYIFKERERWFSLIFKLVCFGDWFRQETTRPSKTWWNKLENWSWSELN
jgi:hypothetical protein